MHKAMNASLASRFTCTAAELAQMLVHALSGRPSYDNVKCFPGAVSGLYTEGGSVMETSVLGVACLCCWIIRLLLLLALIVILHPISLDVAGMM